MNDSPVARDNEIEKKPFDRAAAIAQVAADLARLNQVLDFHIVAALSHAKREISGRDLTHPTLTGG